MKPVTILGMSDDGCVNMGSKAYNRVIESSVIIGSQRFLDFFSDHPGEKFILDGNFRRTVEYVLEECEDRSIVVLASGDPLLFGIGRYLINKIGFEKCEVIPSQSSIQWAFAKIGESYESAKILSFHGRPLRSLIVRTNNYRIVACLTDYENTPQKIAQHLIRYQQTNQWDAYVCSELCSMNEDVWQGSLSDLSVLETEFGMNVLILKRKDEAWSPDPFISYVSEDHYAKKMPKAGLITKTENRVLILSKLNLKPNGCLWDIGAGSGSVGIEAAKLMPEGEVFSIESDLNSVEIIKSNIEMHGTDNVTVISGLAPLSLKGLNPPTAIFIGGSRGQMKQILNHCLDLIDERTPIVISAVTIEAVHEVIDLAKEKNLDLDLCLMSVSRGASVAKKYLRYDALNPIHIFTLRKR